MNDTIQRHDPDGPWLTAAQAAECRRVLGITLPADLTPARQ